MWSGVFRFTFVTVKPVKHVSVIMYSWWILNKMKNSLLSVTAACNQIEFPRSEREGEKTKKGRMCLCFQGNPPPSFLNHTVINTLGKKFVRHQREERKQTWVHSFHIRSDHDEHWTSLCRQEGELLPHQRQRLSSTELKIWFWDKVRLMLAPHY